MISVCMATYNGEEYVREQIASILMQLSDEDELIISDDDSLDSTVKIVQSINDNRIKLYRNNMKHGFTHNFENALGKAKGDFVFLSDQDDVWMPGKIEKMMSKLKEYDFVVSDCLTTDAQLNIINESRFKEFNIKGTVIEHFIKSRYIGCCMAFNRKVLDASLPFPENDSFLEHDIWIAAVAFSFFNYCLIDEPLIMYRRHGNNTSSGGFSKGEPLFVKLKKRIYRLYHIIKRGIDLKKYPIENIKK